MKSEYSDRETVGAIYQKAQRSNMSGTTIGDVNSAMLGGLVDDINDSISSNVFGGRDFYISIVEERDLQMKNAIKRRIFHSLYRPYPEDNTLVFFVEPKSNRVCYCWDLPHHSEFANILSNEFLYDQNYVSMIKDWLREDLTNFGFIKSSMNSSQVEGIDEKTVNMYREAYYNFCKSTGMNEDALKKLKQIGYFWIPNPSYKDKPYKENKPQVLIA